MPEKTFEEKRDAMDDWLDTDNSEGVAPLLQDRVPNRETVSADEILEHIIDNFTPRNLWPDKIDEALEAAHQAGERGDPLEGLDLRLG